MQPALKKVHSVDFAAGSRRGVSGPGQAARNPPLMHSVSIVVELAKEQQPADDRAESLLAGGSGPQERPDEDEANSEHGEEEDEEDEDEGSCLSTELARRVMIVDEADKILWSRAQSAEPLVSTTDGGSGCNLDRVCPGELGPQSTGPSVTRRANTISAQLPSAIQSGLAPRHRLSLATCSSGGAGLGLTGSSGGELAERGALSKLGMRRNTHHHVNLSSNTGAIATTLSTATATPIASYKGPTRSLINQSPRSLLQPARSGSAQLESGPAIVDPALNLSTSISQSKFQQQQQLKSTSSVSMRNWTQRRQSLQISLLTGGSVGLCRLASKSLTEEELRGEREFNEQVRSTKSPEISPSYHTAASPPIKTTNRATFGFRSSPKSGEPEPQLKQARAVGQRQQQYPASIVKTHSRQSQRRVSFSSIDPVLAARSGEVHSRASFAFCPSYTSWPNAQHQKQIQQSADDRELSPEQRHISNLPVTSKQAFPSPESSSTRQQLGQQEPEAGTSGGPEGERRVGQALSGVSQLGAKRNFQSEAPTEAGCLVVSREKLKSYEDRQRNRFRLTHESFEERKTIRDAPKRLSVTSSFTMNDSNNNIIAEARDSKQSSPSAQQRTGPFQAKLGDLRMDEIRIAASANAIKQLTSAEHEKEGNRVQSIMANAKLRQEEFARLLEEHEQIVNEINRVETKMSTSQTNIQQQQQQQQQQQSSKQ